MKICYPSNYTSAPDYSSYTYNSTSSPYALLARAVLYSISEDLYKHYDVECKKCFAEFSSMKEFVDHARAINDEIFGHVIAHPEVQDFLNGKELCIEFDAQGRLESVCYEFKHCIDEDVDGLKYTVIDENQRMITIAPPKFPKGDARYNQDILSIYKTFEKIYDVDIGFASCNGLNPGFIMPFSRSFYSSPSTFSCKPPFSFCDIITLRDISQNTNPLSAEVFNASTFLAWMLYNPDKWTTIGALYDYGDAYLKADFQEPGFNRCYICSKLYVLNPFKIDIPFEDSIKLSLTYKNIMTTSYLCKSSLLPMNENGLYRIADIILRKSLNVGRLKTTSGMNTTYKMYNMRNKRMIRKTDKLEAYSWIRNMKMAILDNLKAITELEESLAVYNEKGIKAFYKMAVNQLNEKVELASKLYNKNKVAAFGIVNGEVYCWDNDKLMESNTITIE